MVERDIDLIADLSARRAVGLADGGDRHGPRPRTAAARQSAGPAAGDPRGLPRPGHPHPGHAQPALATGRSPGVRPPLDAACDRVILDHYLIGDGSPGGWRTRRTGFPERLAAAGFGEWNGLDKLHEVRDLLASVLGPGRCPGRVRGVQRRGSPIR